MDNEYILMCQESTEIQELWKPKIGDKCFDIDDLNGLGIELVGEEDVFCNSQKDYWEGYIWLPRQEDLQELIFTHIAKTMIEDDPEMGHYSIQDFKDVYGYEFLFDEYYYWVEGDFKTFNELWLCFAMDYLFSKKWDSESKTWVSL